MQTPLILLVDDAPQNLAMLRQILSASYKLALPATERKPAWLSRNGYSRR